MKICDIYIIYIYNGASFSHEKKVILPFVTTWMDLEGLMISKMNHTRKTLYAINYMWTLKKLTFKIR